MQSPAQRPRSVTTFGILNIVFAGLGLFGIIASIAMLRMSAASDNPALRIMRDNPAYMTWMKISIPLGLLTLAVLLTAGIGLLRLKPWARLLSIGYAVWALFTSVVGMTINYLVLVRPLLEEAARKQGPEAAGAIGGAVGGIFGGCVGMAYPIVLLIFMTRPNVVQAFRPAPVELAPPPPSSA